MKIFHVLNMLLLPLVGFLIATTPLVSAQGGQALSEHEREGHGGPGMTTVEGFGPAAEEDATGPAAGFSNNHHCYMAMKCGRGPLVDGAASDRFYDDAAGWELRGIWGPGWADRCRQEGAYCDAVGDIYPASQRIFCYCRKAGADSESGTPTTDDLDPQNPDHEFMFNIPAKLARLQTVDIQKAKETTSTVDEEMPRIVVRVIENPDDRGPYDDEELRRVVAEQVGGVGNFTPVPNLYTRLMGHPLRPRQTSSPGWVVLGLWGFEWTQQCLDGGAWCDSKGDLFPEKLREDCYCAKGTSEIKWGAVRE